VEDVWHFPELGRFAAKTIPNATLVELSGIGHIPHHEAPEQFEKALLEFLN
jgi:pimeloyl-ACP methyl ester carboxylesterase